MTRKDLITFIILAIAAAIGIFTPGWIGGVITGSFVMLIIVSSIGKWVANKAARQIEKAIRDRAVEMEDSF